MRSGAAADHRGYFHETAFYSSDDELVAIVVPFLQGGVEAGEPTLVSAGAGNAELIRAALGDTSNVSFLNGDAHYARPASTIKAYQQLLAAYVAQGARQIRIVGEVPHPGTGSPWGWWARYEAVINHAYDDFPLWSICPYDTRITPPHVLADVARTHSHVATADGRHVVNARFESPMDFLTRRPVPGGDPLETASPLIELINPTPGTARRAAADIARVSCLDPDELDSLVTGVNEAVTNGLCHGRPPVRLRLWAGADRVVATVTDRGDGPTDPLAGLLPTTNTSSGGVGLWLIHQICSHVTFGNNDEGFTIRLTVGVPDLAVDLGREPTGRPEGTVA
ncbi:MAG: anti-sigma factor RsbA family regulatory protein [Pseudonocardiaceae bacterium]